MKIYRRTEGSICRNAFTSMAYSWTPVSCRSAHSKFPPYPPKTFPFICATLHPLLGGEGEFVAAGLEIPSDWIGAEGSTRSVPDWPLLRRGGRAPQRLLKTRRRSLELEVKLRCPAAGRWAHCPRESSVQLQPAVCAGAWRPGHSNPADDGGIARHWRGGRAAALVG